MRADWINVNINGNGGETLHLYKEIDGAYMTSQKIDKILLNPYTIIKFATD